MVKTRGKISVVMPAYNEEKIIGKVIKEFKKVSEVIVVDNNSTDRTAELAMNAGAMIVKENNVHYSIYRTDTLLIQSCVKEFFKENCKKIKRLNVK